MNPPAGWHPNPNGDGQLRYWDGQQWTDHYAPGAGRVPINQAQVKAKNRHTGMWVLGGIGGVLLLAVIGVAAGASNSDTTSPASDNTSSSNGGDSGGTTTKASKPKVKPKPTPTYTVSQTNAIRTAKDYLGMGGGFSRAGLIQQLSSKAGEGYPLRDAVFAVNHISVNWNRQAVLSAKSYLSMGGMSRSGLIEQLSSKAGEQFTVAQATYAANHVGLR